MPMMGPTPSVGNSTPPTPQTSTPTPFQGKAPTMTDLYSAMSMFQEMQKGQKKPQLPFPGTASVGGASLAEALVPNMGMPAPSPINGLADALIGVGGRGRR